MPADPPVITARAVVRALLAVVTEDLGGVEAMARLANDEATNADNRAENKYDTRSLEASYLARGQAERVVALRRAASWLRGFREVEDADRVALGTVVTLDVDGERRVIFLLPDEGGRTVEVHGVTVRTVTPKSPVAKAILGLEEGDGAETGTGVEIEILGIAG